MKRLAIPLSIATLALAAACADTTVSPAMGVGNAAPIAPQPIAYAPGYGRVESVTYKAAPQSAATGGSAPSSPAARTARLGIRMEDGTMQYIDTDADQFQKGSRILVRSDHIIQKAP